MIIRPAKPFSTIERLKFTILLSTLFFAFLHSAFLPAWGRQTELFTVTPYHFIWKDLLLAPLSILTLNYTDITLQLLFDVLMLNAIVTPLVSFVFSFLGKRKFLLYALSSGWCATLLLHGLSELFHLPFLSTTLFSFVVLGMITLWALLHAKHTPTMVLFIPMHPITILAISTIVTLYTPLVSSDWVQVGAYLGTMAWAYFVSVFFIRLKSGSRMLAPVERALMDCSLWCQKIYWRIRSFSSRRF